MNFGDTWLLQRMLLIIPLVLSLTVHEWAHAWAATKLGDTTAKEQGRLSLNPVVHIDPLGTLLLPLLGIPFGWAKPVPFNPSRFRNKLSMRWGALLTAAAGPISNVLMALAVVMLLFVLRSTAPHLLLGGALNALLYNLVFLNVILALFNLLPIPPLDGSHIADAIMPRGLRAYWHAFANFGTLWLALLIVVPFLVGFNIFAKPMAILMSVMTALFS